MANNPFLQDQGALAWPGAARPAANAWRGKNRRSARDRRVGGDRREEIRFEPAKEDRRGGRDRRHHAGWDDAHVW
jgi:hypothetical protein